MIYPLLFTTAGLFLIAAIGILIYLYRTSEQRNFGIATDGRKQGIQLILWFTFLGLLVNVILERLVALLDKQYVLVLLPTLLLMVATMLLILFKKVPEEE